MKKKPSTRKREFIRCEIEPALKAELDELAEVSGITVSAILRTAAELAVYEYRRTHRRLVLSDIFNQRCFEEYRVQKRKAG